MMSIHILFLIVNCAVICCWRQGMADSVHLRFLCPFLGCTYKQFICPYVFVKVQLVTLRYTKSTDPCRKTLYYQPINFKTQKRSNVMKSLKGWTILLVMVLFPVLVMAGQTEEKDKNGFFGSILLGGGVASGKPSQLEVTDDNKKIDTLHENADHQTRGIPFISGEIGYGFASTGTRISLGNQRSEKSFADLVVTQPFGRIGTIRASFGYGREEVWADPYITGVDRLETDEDSCTFKLEWKEIAGSNFMTTLKLIDIDVDQDLIGNRYPDLKRDGQLMAAEIGYVFVIGENQMIIPTFNMEMEDRDGESNSGKKAGISVSHAIELGKWCFVSSLSFGKREFDKTHPVFHETREEKEYEISELVTYSRPFGWKGFFINGLVSYSRVDANIDFFNQDELTVGAGLGYEF